MKSIGCPPPLQDIYEEPEECEVEVKKPKEKKGKALPKTSSSGPCKYKAGDFKKVYEDFVKDQKQTGVSHRDALLKWGKSVIRARLLENMPESEKKKRKFA